MSNASHEEAVDAFCKAQEPIIVEVLRPDSVKPNIASNNSSRTLDNMAQCDRTTQTEWTGGWQVTPIEHCSPAPSRLQCRTSSHNVALLNDDVCDTYFRRLQYDNGRNEQSMSCEVEYKEVTIRRMVSKENLGLCFSSGFSEEAHTSVFITQIEEGSLAEKDGRLREGDQVLQINGHDVNTLEEAVSLVTDSHHDLSVLFARTRFQVHYDEGTDTWAVECRHEKDSGVGRTDESTKYDESSETETKENEYPGANFEKRFQRKQTSSENSCYLNNDGEVSEDKVYGYREIIPVQCVGTSTTSLVDCSYSYNCDGDLENLNHALENVQLHDVDLKHVERMCSDPSISSHDRGIKSSDSRKRSIGRFRRLWGKTKSVERWIRNTADLRKQAVEHLEEKGERSSAYDTGTSSGTVRVAFGSMDFQGSLLAPKMEDKETQHRTSDVSSVVSCDSCRNCCQSSAQESGSEWVTSRCSPGFIAIASRWPFPHPQNLQNYVSIYPCTTMYTNKQNLQHTIWLQQQLFRQALAQKHYQQRCSKQNILWAPLSPMSSRPLHSCPNKSNALSSAIGDEDVKMEWKVKRRSDGSRYIAKRPLRNKFLKERALKINEERCGLTTDDDAMSDLKVGRYWPKEERKRHLERARDRKRRELEMRRTMAIVKEEREDSLLTCEKRETEGIEMKNGRKKNKGVLEERRPSASTVAHAFKGQGLLSVTTI
ncbi:E3 ubiquitin-protein ligase PDZRN3-like isoform X1 [Limulus polyphemus]|uniref:E3 ubiquitin-protein ligase PDZRN3-like isoform X1 n=1 Tax=Limulus polyphemus TaxID=6850 RepID=A0ABM1T9X9_LIMPO|nr:E3 ubiquitin-protein ligase PDZRN3-like isoform X1 [Limulus polyphemus]